MCSPNLGRVLNGERWRDGNEWEAQMLLEESRRTSFDSALC